MSKVEEEKAAKIKPLTVKRVPQKATNLDKGVHVGEKCLLHAKLSSCKKTDQWNAGIVTKTEVKNRKNTVSLTTDITK
jgi:hypothetical protein